MQRRKIRNAWHKWKTMPCGSGRRLWWTGRSVSFYAICSSMSICASLRAWRSWCRERSREFIRGKIGEYSRARSWCSRLRGDRPFWSKPGLRPIPPTGRFSLRRRDSTKLRPRSRMGSWLTCWSSSERLPLEGADRRDDLASLLDDPGDDSHGQRLRVLQQHVECGAACQRGETARAARPVVRGPRRMDAGGQQSPNRDAAASAQPLGRRRVGAAGGGRSEEHTSELQ